jgi:branched-subunit amino acid aminotransferase/4-amino-4-deoxychorismate lyase
MAQINGLPVTPGEALRLALTNYGNFTSMRVEDGQYVRGLSLHLDRLARDCETLFAARLDRDRVRRYIRLAIPGHHGSFVIRVTVFDPELDIGRPGAGAEPSILVTSREAKGWPAPALRVRALSYQRELPGVKHVGLCSSLWARRQAQQEGYDDALLTDAARLISEGPSWNIGFWDGEHVIWPEANMLPGVTMRLLKLVHGTTSAPVSVGDVSSMKAAFATNSAVGIQAIAAINDTRMPVDASILGVLRRKYEEIPPEKI